MAKSTLQMIQAIEDRAAQLEQDYQSQITALEEKQEEQLKQETEQLQQDYQESLNAFRQSLEEELASAQNDLKEAQSAYNEKTNDAMTDMREELIANIVKEVVNKYGN